MSERTCPVCTDLIPVGAHRNRKFCSDKCRRWSASHLNPRRCSVDGCTNRHRAKGLCGTHYGQRISGADRHRKADVACAACGKRCEKVASGARRPVCSYRCRYYLQFGKWPTSRSLVPFGGGACSLPATHPVMRLVRIADRHLAQVDPRWKFISGPCAWCGDRFTIRTAGPARYCSIRCGKRANKARHEQAVGGRFQPSPRLRAMIYARDGWTCQLCMEPVDRNAHHLDDWAPSLDHIEPQSAALVPDHTPENLRTAHRWCNAIRGDGSRTESMLLFA